MLHGIRRIEEIPGICFAFQKSHSGKAKVSDFNVGLFFFISRSTVVANLLVLLVLLISSQKLPNCLLVMNQIGIFALFAGGLSHKHVLF